MKKSIDPTTRNTSKTVIKIDYIVLKFKNQIRYSWNPF